MFLIPLLLIIAFFQLIISLGIALESRRSNSTVQRVFAALCTVIFMWTLANIYLLYVDSVSSSSALAKFDIANKLGFFLGGLSVVLIYLFSNFFPVKKKLRAIHKTIIAVGVCILVVAPLPPISGSFTFEEGASVYSPGSFSFIFALYAVLVGLIVYVGNLRAFRSTQNKQLRSQISIITAGLTFTILHAIIFIIILPLVFGDNTLFYAVGYCAPFFYTGMTIYGLVRQNLFDVRLIIARSVAYILVSLSFALIYSLVVFSLSLFIFSDSDLRLTEQIFYIATALFIAASYQPLKRFFDRVTNRLFYRDAYDPQLFLDQLNKELVSNIDLETLLVRCAETIQANIKSDYTLFALKETAYSDRRVVGASNVQLSQDDFNEIRSTLSNMSKTIIVAEDLVDEPMLKSVFKKYDVAVMARLTADLNLEVEGLGYLLLGPKKSGNPYNKQDLQIIEIIANELVIAVQNALRFEEIEKFNVTLQQRVDDATAELKRTNQRLKDLDETKDEFISMASHQLRTPLTSVKGYLSMVLEGDVGDVPQSQRKMLDQAFISSQRMVYLIADLLNVSRLKTGKFIIEPKATNLADVVEGEVTQLLDTAKSRKLKLSYDKPKDFPTLYLDETKIRQVIMNFIDNAIYYTPADGHIEVMLKETEKTIEYRVKDDGIGVPKAERHHLFNKFYRAGNAKKARPDGTGLGLFMAKKVVLAQGGAVIFESEEGKGSTFGFTFDKAKLQTPPASEEKPQEAEIPNKT